MVATPVPVTEITRAGITPPAATTGDTVNGHSVVNDGYMHLDVSNSAGAPGTLTISYPQTVDGQAITPKAITIPATTNNVRIGPFPVQVYGTTINFTVSAATVTLRAWHQSPTQ